MENDSKSNAISNLMLFLDCWKTKQGDHNKKTNSKNYSMSNIDFACWM